MNVIETVFLYVVVGLLWSVCRFETEDYKNGENDFKVYGQYYLDVAIWPFYIFKAFFNHRKEVGR